MLIKVGITTSLGYTKNMESHKHFVKCSLLNIRYTECILFANCYARFWETDAAPALEDLERYQATTQINVSF